MPTTFVNTIDGDEILAKRSQCDYAGNDLQTTYATKSELPTATSDLTNDSGFITSSDIPVKDVQVGGESVVNVQGVAEISIPQTGVLDVEVDGSSVVNSQGVAEISMPTFTQVNADWAASSGVSEILNKPDLSIYAESSDLATVATSGSYDDLLDKPSIPSAQVNADWDATSGVSAILNKPNLATVATTGDYSDLQNLPSIPAAQVNSDWSATSGVAQILNKPTIPSVDQSYSASSTNAQSGVAVAQAIASIPSSSYTAGNGIDITNNVVGAKVDGTTVSTNASGELTVIGGGGGSQVNSDWDATSGVAEILNKPTPKTLTAGANISISEGVGTLTISAAAGLPASTSADEGKCLVVDSNGDPEWGTGGKTYTGTDGVVVDNVNDTVGLEAPVDIVAGPGIHIDNPDGNTLRVSMGIAGSWTDVSTEASYSTTNINAGSFKIMYNPALNLVALTCDVNVGAGETTFFTWSNRLKPVFNDMALGSNLYVGQSGLKQTAGSTSRWINGAFMWPVVGGN